jgi:predicted kinase
VARPVLINGAPASGKSTLAQMYIDEHPLTLALDIDVIRAMLGRWLDHPIEAVLTARRMALEMARVQLSAGRDVLFPQIVGRLDFVLELEHLCRQVGAKFIELVLFSSPQDTADRFARRSRHPETSEHLRRCRHDRQHGAAEQRPERAGARTPGHSGRPRRQVSRLRRLPCLNSGDAFRPCPH